MQTPMRATLTAFIFGSALTASVVTSLARDQEAYTVEGGVICFSPFQIKQAHVAAKNGDIEWLKSIGCIPTKDGIKVILIDKDAPLGRDWQVRIFPDGAPAHTVGGDSSSFTSTQGGKSFWSKYLSGQCTDRNPRARWC